ncbi:SDR family oxidoreductase [Lichenicola cladoniae]|uniref:SDR family oxidoreductase n=1 Tax=Lichenicola cladoniae TaxID=1484109 RepID=A0A6M8HT52_9PROT|nr:SDR family NAD(P)-dependent oxidoreductase [Lichenicola cladoniae]NPD67758.1 SDR family oxidoreductase [Acetobacteraceae bacterium]QKE91683.1 SDR family oxidoreductase [Lichenicola cladoniae]
MTAELPRGLGRMKDKVAVITGASNGIGRATALLFAAEGARLVINDIDAPRLEELRAAIAGSGAEVRSFVGDVSKNDDARAMVAEAVDGFGRLDVLVANAGIIPELDLLTATAEDFDHVMAIDGRGMFLTCKFAAEAMLQSGGGAIVCLSSISGEAGQKGQAVYGPAKFVASGITKHLAVELATRGIRVNAVAPGTITTEAVKKLSDAYVDDIKARHPMARLGRPAEVAQAILFLASDDASFITGAVLPVDGGYLAQ